MMVFGKHSKQHSSKTKLSTLIIPFKFGKHSKQHSSKTFIQGVFQ